MRFEVVSNTELEAASTLVGELSELGFDVELCARHTNDPQAVAITVVAGLEEARVVRGAVMLSAEESLVEQTLQRAPLEFDGLPLLVEGDSKIIRRWTPRVVVERFKPTVYSFTHNRYGVAPGTESSRARFSAQVYRRMARLEQSGVAAPRSAFLGLLESPQGLLMVQRLVEACNLEVRIKRYHIGSPVHRYRYTDRYPSTQTCGALARWSRFDRPVVCFDWRHPLSSDEGERLADEPISDDYAGVWMENVEHAKEMAKNTFLWLESVFRQRDLMLVDMCLFIDRAGQMIFGEISPDCMRVRSQVSESDPERTAALDKDVWRQGATREHVAARYDELYQRVFGSRP